jgi:chemotaxis protein methyltransferase CheR
MKTYSQNYLNAGGLGSLSDYYTAMYENAVFRKELLKNVTWARHNLVSDRSFNEFDLILCRNVLIYFNKTLQERVHKLIFESLSLDGFLAVGNKESIHFTGYERYYNELDAKEKIYQKVKNDK